MAYTVRKVEVWAGDFLNRPGVLARVLEALTEAGAELEFIIGRRITERTARIFVSPLKGKKQKDAAADVGLVPATGMNAVRIEGPDRRGLGAEVARLAAAADINIRGVSAAKMGRRAILYLAFRDGTEAGKAAGVLSKALNRKSR